LGSSCRNGGSGKRGGKREDNLVWTKRRYKKKQKNDATERNDIRISTRSVVLGKVVEETKVVLEETFKLSKGKDEIEGVIEKLAVENR